MAMHPFGWNVDWGNAPGWAGTVLSAVSVLLVIGVILRDRRRVIRDQASQIFVGVDWQQPAPPGDSGGGLATVTVYNPSDAQIRMVLVEYSPFPKTWPKLVFSDFEKTYGIADYLKPGIKMITAQNYSVGMRIVPPKSKRSYGITVLEPYIGESLSYETILSFYDVHNRQWIVNSKNGKVKRRHRYNPVTSVRYRRRQNALKKNNQKLAKTLSETPMARLLANEEARALQAARDGASSEDAGELPPPTTPA